MKAVQVIPNKIFTLTSIILQLNRWRLLGKKIVFTNGVFDILHQGHIASLSEERTKGWGEIK